MKPQLFWQSPKSSGNHENIECVVVYSDWVGKVCVVEREEYLSCEVKDLLPSNDREIADAKRANELGLVVPVPEAVYKVTGPFFKESFLRAEYRKILQEAVFNLVLENWQYQRCDLPSGVEFNISHNGYSFELKAYVDCSKCFTAQGRFFRMSYHSWEVWSLLVKDTKEKMPQEVIAQIEAFILEMKAIKEREKQEFDKEELTRLKKKYGIQ